MQRLSGHPSDILHLDLCFDIQVFLSFITECDVWNQNRLKIIPEGNESIMQCWILSKYAFPKPFGEGIAFLRGLGSKWGARKMDLLGNGTAGECGA